VERRRRACHRRGFLLDAGRGIRLLRLGQTATAPGAVRRAAERSSITGGGDRAGGPLLSALPIERMERAAGVSNCLVPDHEAAQAGETVVGSPLVSGSDLADGVDGRAGAGAAHDGGHRRAGMGGIPRFRRARAQLAVLDRDAGARAAGVLGSVPAL